MVALVKTAHSKHACVQSAAHSSWVQSAAHSRHASVQSALSPHHAQHPARLWQNHGLFEKNGGETPEKTGAKRPHGEPHNMRGAAALTPLHVLVRQANDAMEQTTLCRTMAPPMPPSQTHKQMPKPDDPIAHRGLFQDPQFPATTAKRHRLGAQQESHAPGLEGLRVS